MKKFRHSRSFAAALCCVVISLVSLQIAEAKAPSYAYTPKSYETVEVEHNWADADHYLKSEQVVEWAESGKATSEPYPFLEPTEEMPKYGGEWTLRTNLLYWLGGLMNIGAEYRFIDKSWGLLINGGYSPFSEDGWKRNLGGWFVAPEVRYYLGCRDQWFIGAQFLASGYNVLLSPSSTGAQGSLLGGGVVGGYKLYLSPTFDMDFTLGVGYVSATQDRYTYCDGSYLMKAADEKMSMLFPVQIGVNLIWKLQQR